MATDRTQPQGQNPPSLEVFKRTLTSLDTEQQGKLLRGLRKTRGDTQTELGAVLGLSTSMVSNLERGIGYQRGWQDEMIGRLYEHFHGVLSTVLASQGTERAREGEGLLGESAFLKIQAEHLSKVPHTVYTLLAAKALTTFFTDATYGAWSQYLNQGHKARILFALDLANIPALQHFLMQVRRLESVVAEEHRSNLPIRVQGLGFISSRVEPSLLAQYEQYAQSHSHLAPVLHVGGPDVPFMGWGCEDTTHIVHRPNTPSLEHYPWATLRFDVLGDFKGNEHPGPHYLPFGPSTKYMAANNRIIEQYEMMLAPSSTSNTDAS